MKFAKIASAAAAIAAAGMMTISASAVLTPVKDKGEKLHESTGAQWLLVPFFDGKAKADQGKPVGTVDGLDFSKVVKFRATVSVVEEDQPFWDGQFYGAVFFSMNGGPDIGSYQENENPDLFPKYNWQSQAFSGVEDFENIDESCPIKTVMIDDYTYTLTSNEFDNPLADGVTSEIGLVQFGIQDYAASAMAAMQVDKFELMDASGNVLATFDGKGNVTSVSGGSSSTPAPDNTDNTTPSTPNNVDTGVEGVAAVVGVAALAAGAVVLSRKRK